MQFKQSLPDVVEKQALDRSSTSSQESRSLTSARVQPLMEAWQAWPQEKRVRYQNGMGNLNGWKFAFKDGFPSNLEPIPSKEYATLGTRRPRRTMQLD